jgi:hypothetical protein
MNCGALTGSTYLLLIIPQHYVYAEDQIICRDIHAYTDHCSFSKKLIRPAQEVIRMDLILWADRPAHKMKLP